MRKLVAYLQLALAYLILWPHLLLFVFSDSTTREFILADVRRLNDKMSVHMYGINSVLYVIFRDAYYRKLFYKRIGTKSLLVSWYFPGERTFEPICPEIGAGIYLAHPSSTYLNAKCIGENFTCRQNTTIGNKYEGNQDERPSIGNNVHLGANVCIIGDVRIGNNVMIGAGSVVVKDIPDNCVAVGNPARVINENYAQN